MKSILLFLLPITWCAWYLLGLYDGILRGYVDGYLKAYKNSICKFAKGWVQGFDVARSKYKSRSEQRRDIKTGRWLA